MGQLTQSEINDIEDDPLEKWIREARDELRKAEEASAKDNTSEADDSTTEPEPPRLYIAAVGKLLNSLADNKASPFIPSRMGSFDIGCDLDEIKRRLDKGELDHNLFRPLTQLVTTQAPDVEIWEAVDTLIKTIVPPPSLPPSQQGSEQTRGEIEPGVFKEIRHCTYQAVEGFHEKYFEERPWSQRAKEVYTASQHYYDNDKKRWKIEGMTEEAICDWWLRFQIEFLGKEKASYFRSSENELVGSEPKRQKLVESEPKRQLDLFVKAKSASEDEQIWQSVLVVGELKKTDKKDKSLWLHVGSAVQNVFAHQPTRRFVHAFTLTGTEMETWVFDRSGPFSGTVFDIHDEPEKFTQVLCGYLMMSDEELGIDTFPERENNKLFVTLPGPGGKPGNKKFEIDRKPIARQRAIVGRGTSCYLAKTAGTDEYDTVMKFSWTSSLRNREADLLIKASERGVKGVARVVGYQEEITSIQNLRTSLTFPKPHKSRNPPHSNGASFSQSQQQQPFDNRVLRALATVPSGRSIRHFTSVLELIGSLRDAIIAHRSLFIDGNILHRDISEDNIIITDPEKADGFRGMLIDLDLAKEGPSDAGYRSGTLQFVAIEVLYAEPHTYRHDLESFFYVLVWLCSRRGWALTGTRSYHHYPVTSGWYTGTYKEIAYDKEAVTNICGQEYLKEFPPLFDAVRPLCGKLRRILFRDGTSVFTGTPPDPETLYGPIIKAFDDFLKEMESN